MVYIFSIIKNIEHIKEIETSSNEKGNIEFEFQQYFLVSEFQDFAHHGF